MNAQSGQAYKQTGGLWPDKQTLLGNREQNCFFRQFWETENEMTNRHFWETENKTTFADLPDEKPRITGIKEKYQVYKNEKY